jgi:hypothetical protein
MTAIAKGFPTALFQAPIPDKAREIKQGKTN